MNIENFEKIKDKKILVFGFARSGYKTAKILAELGVSVTLTAIDDLSDNEDSKILKRLGVTIIDKGHPLSLLENVDLIVKNPGVPYSVEFIAEAIKLNIPIITEIELAGTLYNNNLIAITGSNGKTTTTTLAYEILKLVDKNIKLAGNIGYPAIEVASKNENSNIIMELSSFQLNGIVDFKPHIAVITNLGEAHLDYHGSIEEYHKVKKNIYKNQTAEDYLILNINEKHKFKLEDIKSKIIFYSTIKNSEAEGYVEDNWFVFRGEKIFEISELSLPGEHNLENSINAAIISKLENIDNDTIKKVLYSFSGVKHRMQYVGEYCGVKYYNDSKATNPVSTSKALSGFDGNVILICGGKDRGIDFRELLEYKEKIKAIICVGESKNILKSMAEKNNIDSYLGTKVDDATILAHKLSDNGDTILLSPACASWDQYPNFEVRGEEFISTYNKIKNKELI